MLKSNHSKFSHVCRHVSVNVRNCPDRGKMERDSKREKEVLYSKKVIFCRDMAEIYTQPTFTYTLKSLSF